MESIFQSLNNTQEYFEEVNRKFLKKTSTEPRPINSEMKPMITPKKKIQEISRKVKLAKTGTKNIQNYLVKREDMEEAKTPQIVWEIQDSTEVKENKEICNVNNLNFLVKSRTGIKKSTRKNLSKKVKT